MQAGIFLISLFFLSGSSEAVETLGGPARSCSQRGSGFQSCADRDAYRKKAMRLQAEPRSLIGTLAQLPMCQKNPVIDRESGILCAPCRIPQVTTLDLKIKEALEKQSCDLKSLYGSFTPAEQRQDIRDALLELGRKAVSEIQNKRKLDVLNLSAFMQQEGIKPSVTPSDLDASIKSLNQHLLGVQRLLMRTSGRTKLTENIGFSVIQEWNQNFRDHVETNLKNNDAFRSPAELQMIKSRSVAERRSSSAGSADTVSEADSLRFARLLVRAESDDQGQFNDEMTPYSARILLLHHVENSIRAKYASNPKLIQEKLDGLARKMSLKYDVPGKTGWEASLFHDGYVFGADTGASEALVDPASSESQGLDCSAFIESLFKNMNLWEQAPTGRWTTKTMAKMNIAKSRPICSEKDLKPGDVVVTHGHTYIFSGYRGGEHPEMMVIDARGNPNRTVLESPMDLYEGKAGDDCRSSSFTQKEHLVLDFLPKK